MSLKTKIMVFLRLPGAIGAGTRALGMAAMVAGLSGCGKGDGARLASPEQIPAAMAKAFDGAKPDLKTEAWDVAEAVKEKNYPKAFMVSQALMENREMTTGQRQAAAQASAMLLGKLTEAANGGNAEAAEVLKNYKRSR
jgi:hypothetical protein